MLVSHFLCRNEGLAKVAVRFGVLFGGSGCYKLVFSFSCAAPCVCGRVLRTTSFPLTSHTKVPPRQECGARVWLLRKCAKVSLVREATNETGEAAEVAASADVEVDDLSLEEENEQGDDGEEELQAGRLLPGEGVVARVQPHEEDHERGEQAEHHAEEPHPPAEAASQRVGTPAERAREYSAPPVLLQCHRRGRARFVLVVVVLLTKHLSFIVVGLFSCAGCCASRRLGAVV